MGECKLMRNLLVSLAIVIAAVGAFVIGASVVENGWLL